MAPLQHPLDADHQGPLVNIAAWTFMVFMCFAVISKVASKLWKIHKAQHDDYLITAAMVIAIVQTVVTSLQVSAGLGQRQERLSASQIKEYQKTGYSSQILYILTLGLAKMATLAFLKTIARTTLSRWLCLGTTVLVFAWTIAGVISIGFQCPLPRAWEILSGECFNQQAFWDVFGSFDIVIDVMSTAIPLYVVWNLQMLWRKKVLTLMVFCSKLLVIPLTVLRLVYITAASDSSDHTYDDLNTVIATEVGMHVSIIVTCFPFLKTIMDNLQPGAFTSDVRTAASNYSYLKKTSYALRSLTNPGREPNLHRAESISQQWLRDHGQEDPSISAPGRTEPWPRHQSGDGSEGIAIHRRIDVEVHSEDASLRPKEQDT